MPGSMPWVCALNALQNSMMFKPRCPSAGPMGGDGLALPAGTCSLMKPTTFFATIQPFRFGIAVRRWHASRKNSFPRFASRHSNPRETHKTHFRSPPAATPTLAARVKRIELHFLHLRILQLDRGGAAEDRDRDLDPRFLLVDLFDEAVERGERPFLDANLLADLEDDRGLRPLDAFLDLLHDPHRLGFRDRLGLALAAEETGDFRRVLDQVPRLVGQVHLHQ